jgi:hypothetical protein
LCDVSGTCECQPFVCRTAGFWSTHAGYEKGVPVNITLAVLNLDGPVEICGVPVTNTALGAADSALEAMCVSPRGAPNLQLARQLTALALNCIFSGGQGDCSGILGPALAFAECNATCIAATDLDPNNNPTTAQITGCVAAVDCLNNGGDPFIIPGVCVTGTCSSTEALCSGSCPPDGLLTQTCDPFPDNCHDKPLETETFDFEPPGPASSSKACNDAKGNQCTLFICP